jgi:peptidoglycan/LPS O-acetylase OafA/YrhL
VIDANYPSLSRVLSDSLLWRLAEAGVDAIAAAWRSSRSARLTTVLGRLSHPRSLVLVCAIAGALALAAQLAIPTYVRSGLPIVWPLTAVLLVIAVAIVPSSFERAWPRSAMARMLSKPQLDR